MLGDVLKFELRYHAKQVTAIVSALLFFLLGMVIVQGGFGGNEVHKNAPYVINVAVCFLSLFSIFACTLLCGNVVLRDITYKTDALLFTTSIQRITYFISRFAGLFATVFAILCLAVLGTSAGAMFASADRLGAFDPLYFLWPILVFGLPNVLFCTSVLFSIALLSGSLRAVYVAGVALFILYFIASILGNSPMMASSVMDPDGPDLLSLLLDPFGMTSFFWETKSWSVLQRNHQLFQPGAVFLANRLVWVAVSALLLVLSYRFFPFHPVLPKPVKSKSKVSGNGVVLAYQTFPVLPKGFLYYKNVFLSQLRLDMSGVFQHILFLLVLGLWVFLFAVELKENIFFGPYGVRFYALTGMIVEELVSIKPALLLLIFYASELIHREKAANMQMLVYSTPVPDAVLWSAKCTTLAVLIGILITVNIGIGLVLQLVSNQPVVDWVAYLSLYYYSGLPLLLFALLIVFIQTVTPNKYLGILLSLLAIGITIFGRRLGITHYLLRYATVPNLEYSDMNGFGHDAKAFNWYMLYWSLLAVILGFLSAGIWKNSGYDTWWKRVRTMGQNWNVTAKWVLIASTLLWAGTGTYIWQHTNNVSVMRDRKELDWQAEYEQKYQRYAHLPQPIITAVKTTVDLYPDEGKYVVKGSYRLQNKSNVSITKLWIGTDPEVNIIRISIKDAQQKSVDEEFKQYWYQLKKPLLPGAEMSLDFSMEVMRSGFVPFNSENSVVSNGTYIELEKYVPYFGYRAGYEISDPATRKEKGLKALVESTIPDPDYHLIDFETIISTKADQHVVTVGSLLKEWNAGDRRYFSYKSELPIHFMFALSSARYAFKNEVRNGTKFRIYYQPGHESNVPAMMLAMQDAIDYGKAQFSDYQFKHIALAEIPQYPGSATAYPGVIFSKERFNFSTDFRDTTKFDFTYATTAHEVAHQWWANQLSPLDTVGGPFLESLAKYTEALVAEKRFGKMNLKSYLEADNALYFNIRSAVGEKELPLNRASEQTFVYYQKGGLALYAIQEALGEKHVSEALQRLLQKHGYPNKKATPDDLIAELKRSTTSHQARLIDEYLKKVITYDSKLKLVKSQTLSNGNLRLTLKINVKKTDETDALPKHLKPDEDIAIAVFDQSEAQWNRATKPIYFQRHHFTKNETIMTLEVNKNAKMIILDPFVNLLDEERSDNVVQLQ